jgi:long-chain acyl-CoA synthetase
MTQAAATVELRDSRRQGRTIGRLWLDATSQNRTSPAYLVERNGTWVEVSWEEASRAVDELAHGLLSHGVRKGDAFAIVAQTTLEWALFDFALALIGAIGAPIYANSSAKATRTRKTTAASRKR